IKFPPVVFVKGVPSLVLEGVLSFVFVRGMSSLVSVIGFPIFIFVRGVIFLVFRKGPSYHHLLHI
ncbi:Hypothetical protein FKW44_006537, partial [Caligus rogercresseyi]